MGLLKTKIQVLFLLVEITALAIGKRSFPCWRPLQSLRLLKKDLSEKKKLFYYHIDSKRLQQNITCGFPG